MQTTRMATGSDGDSMQQTVREWVGDRDECGAVMGSSTCPVSSAWYTHSVVVCYRYVTLVWQSGGSRLQRRQLKANDVERLSAWHRKCSKTPAAPEQSSMTSTVSAFFCGNSCRKRNPMKMVNVCLSVCWNTCDCYYIKRDKSVLLKCDYL